MPKEMIEVEVGGECIEVADVILSLFSEVFEGMLEGGNKLIVLSDESKEEFKAFVRFLDPATAHMEEVTQENLEFLLRWSTEYKVQGVRKRCEDALLWWPASLNNLVQAHRFNLARACPHLCASLGPNLQMHEVEELMQKAPEILKDVLPHLAKSPQFDSKMIRSIYFKMPGITPQLMASIFQKMRFMEGGNEEEEEEETWPGRESGLGWFGVAGAEEPTEELSAGHTDPVDPHAEVHEQVVEPAQHLPATFGGAEHPETEPEARQFVKPAVHLSADLPHELATRQFQRSFGPLGVQPPW